MERGKKVVRVGAGDGRLEDVWEFQDSEELFPS